MGNGRGKRGESRAEGEERREERIGTRREEAGDTSEGRAGSEKYRWERSVELGGRERCEGKAVEEERSEKNRERKQERERGERKRKKISLIRGERQ